MINEQGVESIRSTLLADGYEMEVREAGERVGVRITATPDACEECLVPKELMLTMLEQALEVPSASIDLAYPLDVEPAAGA
jgi:hypothetical protein